MSATLDKVGPVRLHRCSGCGIVAPWGPGWVWPHVVGEYYDARVTESFCPKCADGRRV